MKFIINKKQKSNIPSVKLIDLGSNLGSIDNLLDETIVYIDQNTVPLLSIDGVNYLINNFNPNDYKEDFEILLTELDLVNLSAGRAGTGVESVTGDSVDNTNTLNPIINAIPLSGTTVGSPVTGTIETNAEVFIQTPTTQFIDDFGGLRIDSEYGLTYKNSVNNASTISTGEDIVMFKVSSPNLLARGISSNQDYTPNITDLDYVQKKYVDTYTQRTTATSGTVNIDSGRRDLVLIHEAGATTALTLNLPTSPKNNQKVTIMSVGGIVGLTLATVVGTIVGAVTTLAALGTTKLIWNSSQSKWYKIS